MSTEAVARRYAAALAEVVTKHNEASEVQQELAAWERMMDSNGQLLTVFRNPTVPLEQKRRVLNTLIARARVRPTTANFLSVLLQNNRLVNLPQINRRFDQELDERAAIITAHVTTARPVPESAQENLRARLATLTGNRVRLDFKVDEDLIGGIVTRIGSTIYDGSVRSQLQQIKERMAGEH